MTGGMMDIIYTFWEDMKIGCRQDTLYMGGWYTYLCSVGRDMMGGKECVVYNRVVLIFLVCES